MSVVAELGDLFYTMQNILDNLAHMFTYKISRVHLLQLGIYSQQNASSQSFMNNMSSNFN